MEGLTKHRRAEAFIISAIYLIFVVVVGVLVYLRGIDNLVDIYLINIGIDVVGMMIGYVLYICCMIDVQKSGANLKHLLSLINVAYLGLFADACAWLLDGVPNLRILNIIDNTIYYFCAPMEAYFFWLYTMTYLKVNKGIVKKLGTISKVGLYIALGLRVLNLFNGIYFTVDEMGFYHRSPLYIVSLVYALFTLFSALTAVVVERKQLQRFQIYTFFVFAIAPASMGIITTGIYGLSPTPVTVMLTILMMYCVLNVTQGRERAVADRDLTLASAIQENMLPKIFPYRPDREEFDLFATMNTAKEVGGDFYDYFMVDEDHLALVMADVSGKGIPAALFMMVSKTLIKNRVQAGDSPSEALINVNRQLCEGNSAELFVTVWLAILDITTGKGVAVNAGHEHPAFKKAGGEYELVVYRHSPAVATLDGIKYKDHEFELNPGDMLFVYTDGVTEATNINNELFGEKRLLEALNSDKDADPQQILSNVQKHVDGFVKDADQFDDITMLCLKYNGKK
ncbi:PP2C family protein-serine/threonine phosphatase [Butyrivibrio sp. FCS014]|uniref:PP2C family protein-serine/threonine phosphatase n=1 Tax=Butyrivibrio sp. FCS014 TaxID=1408304 RepID=UPI0004665575|nr:PP2C family protein-serine/threonine phosphatase [Butyrivibrio sp. FCS014]